MTSDLNGVYESLKNNGVALIQSTFVWDPQIIHQFKDQLSIGSNEQFFETLFTSFYADGTKQSFLMEHPIDVLLMMKKFSN